MLGWVGSAGAMATAAGVLIAATSVLVTMYVTRPAGADHFTPVAGTFAAQEYQASLPGADKPVSITIAPRPKGAVSLKDVMPKIDANDHETVSKNNVILWDDNGGATVIPFNTMRVVY